MKVKKWQTSRILSLSESFAAYRHSYHSCMLLLLLLFYWPPAKRRGI